MDIEKALGMLQNKLLCMQQCDTFNREDKYNQDDCDNCEYCYGQGNFGEQKQAFQKIIDYLKESLDIGTSNVESDTLTNRVLSMRCGDFTFAKKHFLGSDKDVFPTQIDIVKWEYTAPHQVFNLDTMQYHTSDKYCFVIGTLIWCDSECAWKFDSCGTRYLEYGTDELNKWLLNFCNHYFVQDGVLMEVDDFVEA